MIKIGEFNTLKVIRNTSIGMYLDDGADGILLPKRFVSKNTNVDDLITVFVYHDKENRLIATTQKPIGTVGDIVLLRCVSATPQGAYLDNGLMKDLFIPRSNQIHRMANDSFYLIKIYLDNISGKLVGTERLDPFLDNVTLTVGINDEVDLLVYRKTEIGYQMIINNIHLGLLHQNEVYRIIKIGDQFKGFIKTILPGNKIDVVAGKQGFTRTEGEGGKIIRLLKEHEGYLPYHDKSDPEMIYSFFEMSKKTFKMTIGILYKQKKILLEKEGIRLSY
ncbi:MAG: S1-like domain-containing RNA-binding protein [Saprospiraceae bacterium]